MMHRSTILWIGFAGAMLTLISSVAHETRQRTDELRNLHAQIADERSRIEVLRAEWATENDPARLQELSTRLLSMVQVTAEDIVTLDDLPIRPNPTGNMPSASPESLTPGTDRGVDRGIVHSASFSRQPPPTAPGD